MRYPSDKINNGYVGHVSSQDRVHQGLDENLSAVVKGRGPDLHSWSEQAQITSLSGSGAGFFMAKSCGPGQLVSLILPMPQYMRRYDHDKRLYRVWGLVQHCYEATGDAGGFHVGVALIGKDSPSNYHKDPSRTYRVCGMRKNGLWRVEELETGFVQRSAARYWKAIDVTLSLENGKSRSDLNEQTVTENIGDSGAAVISELRVSVGDPVVFRTTVPNFSSLAIVRDRRIGLDDRTRLHLEFIERKFPIAEIK